MRNNCHIIIKLYKYIRVVLINGILGKHMELSEIRNRIKMNPEVLSTKDRTRSFLADVFFNNQVLINVMMNAYDIGIIDAITNSNSFTKNQLISGITSRFGVEETRAKEAVEMWTAILTPDVIAVTGPIQPEGIIFRNVIQSNTAEQNLQMPIIYHPTVTTVQSSLTSAQSANPVQNIQKINNNLSTAAIAAQPVSTGTQPVYYAQNTPQTVIQNQSSTSSTTSTVKSKRRIVIFLILGIGSLITICLFVVLGIIIGSKTTKNKTKDLDNKEIAKTNYSLSQYANSSVKGYLDYIWGNTDCTYTISVDEDKNEIVVKLIVYGACGTALSASNGNEKSIDTWKQMNEMLRSRSEDIYSGIKKEFGSNAPSFIIQLQNDQNTKLTLLAYKNGKKAYDVTEDQ